MNQNNYQVKDEPLGNQNSQQLGHNLHAPFQPNSQPRNHQEGDMIPIYPVNFAQSQFPHPVNHNGQPPNYYPLQTPSYPPLSMQSNNQGRILPAEAETVTIQMDGVGSQQQTANQKVTRDPNIGVKYLKKPVKITCPYCHKEGMTVVTEKINGRNLFIYIMFTIFCILFIFCLFTDAIKEFRHSCSHCGKFIESSLTSPNVWHFGGSRPHGHHFNHRMNRYHR